MADQLVINGGSYDGFEQPVSLRYRDRADSGIEQVLSPAPDSLGGDVRNCDRAEAGHQVNPDETLVEPECLGPQVRTFSNPGPHGLNMAGRWVGLGYDDRIMSEWASMGQTREESDDTMVSLIESEGWPASMIELCEVIITAPDPDWLKDFSRKLVEQRLRASAHNFAPVQSIYERTEGRVSLHTRRDRMMEIVALAKQEHPYEVPGISTRTITDGNPDYLAWIAQETASN